MTARRTTKAAAALLVLVGTTVAGIAVASADETGGTVAICHRTTSRTTPYRRIAVPTHLVDGDFGNDGDRPDHYLEHRGPIGPIDTATWGDIIPPVPGRHAGLNWSPAGRSIYELRCKVPKDTPSR
ncbi:MAG: hypothetical protein U0Q22_14300 [Acidimicrobiales bacterium]